jgi:hypothetical protein
MLAKRWREHGDRDAAHKLVTSHLRLVTKIARDHGGYGLPISEAISEGNVGLMQAVERFEPEKGFRFACACRKSNPDILVVQPAENWAAKNVPGPLDGARDRRILLQG